MAITHFRAKSRDAANQLLDHLSDISSNDAFIVAEELYALSEQLYQQRILRLALTDAAIGSDEREKIVHQLFLGKISSISYAVISTAVKAKWSHSDDFIKGLEFTANEALFTAAQIDDSLQNLSQQLLSIADLCKNNPGIEQALTDQRVPLDERAQWFRALLEGKIDRIALDLIIHNFNKKLPVDVFIELAEHAVAKLGYKLAIITTASPITDQQVQELHQGLSEIFGQNLVIHADINPTIIGGVVVRVGYEIIDGSITHRLLEARNSFV